MNQQPSFKRILGSDYTVSFTFWALLINWGIFFIVRVLEQQRITSWDIPLISVALTIIAIIVLIWRIKVIGTIFEDGIQTSGLITKISFIRNQRTFKYTYIFQGQEYKSGIDVVSSRQTREFVVGQPVTLLVDPAKPKRALIRELFQPIGDQK